MADKKNKPYLANLVLKSDVYNLNSITTEATTENKFQICLSKLNSFQTKEIALNDIQTLIASNKTNHKALRHFISALKIQNKSSNISNSSKEAQAKIYGIIAKEYKDNLYDPIDKPPNLLKSIERLLTQLREGYLQSNEQIQKEVAESYIKILIYCMPKDDISLIILVFFEPLIDIINSGANLIYQQGAALVLCKLIEYVGSGMISNIGENNFTNILEIIATKTINNLLKGTPVDNHYAIDALYQLMLFVKFDVFNDRLKDIYIKLINYLKYKEFNYQLKISVLKVFELIADNILSSDTDKIIGYFQQDILDILTDKTSDRIHKVQLQAREALNKWKKIEQIFLTEERQKENYILNNEQDDYFNFRIENNLNNNMQKYQLKNIDNNTTNPRIPPSSLRNRNRNTKRNKNEIINLKNNELQAAEKEDKNSLANLNNGNNFIIDEYQNNKNGNNNKNNLNYNNYNNTVDINLIQDFDEKKKTINNNSNNNIDTIISNNNNNNHINKDDNIVNYIENNNENNLNGNSNLISLLKSSLSKAINDSLTNSQNYINEQISSKLNTMDQRINDLQVKISKINKNKNIPNKNKYVYNFQEENQLNLNLLPKQKIDNLMASQKIETKINEAWKEALKLLEKNKISDAYRLILMSGDDIYLLRLVCITGPVLRFLDEDLAKKVLVRINMINRGQHIKNVLIQLVEESLKLIDKNNNNIFYSLSFKEQNDIVDSLFVMFKNKKNNALTIKAQSLYSQIIEESKKRNSQK